jgi:hypothetical protein
MEVVMRFADIERPNRIGRRTVAISASAAAEALEAGYSSMVVDEARATVLVIGSDDAVLTVLRGNCARRQRKSRQRARGRAYWGAR